MSNSPLFERNYRPQFSGHETFPLRYGWLKKAFDCVAETESEPENKTHCWGKEAIARFGVGKNMVSSIRHWSVSSGIIQESNKRASINTTKFGQYLFGDEDIGIDPYLEHPSSLWLIHWNLATNEKKTTWYWAFNHYSAKTFSRNLFVQKLDRFSQDRNWQKVSLTTIKNDVACFIRTYSVQQVKGNKLFDSVLESPLTELGIIKPLDDKDGFRFAHGPKPSLGDGIFIYAILDFWSRRYRNSKTLPFEAVVYEPGSPGRVFALDEDDINDRLSRIEYDTNGKIRWSETAGLKQVVRLIEIDENLKFSHLISSYPKYQ